MLPTHKRSLLRRRRAINRRQAVIFPAICRGFCAAICRATSRQPLPYAGVSPQDPIEASGMGSARVILGRASARGQSWADTSSPDWDRSDIKRHRQTISASSVTFEMVSSTPTASISPASGPKNGIPIVRVTA